MPETRICRRCGEAKPMTEFAKNQHPTKGFYRSYLCHTCRYRRQAMGADILQDPTFDARNFLNQISALIELGFPIVPEIHRRMKPSEIPDLNVNEFLLLLNIQHCDVSRTYRHTPSPYTEV